LFKTLSPAPKLYAIGGSMGAAVLLQSLDVETRYRAVVAEGSYSTFPDVAYLRMSQGTGLPLAWARWLMVPIVEPGMLYAHLRYQVTLSSISPEEAVRRTRIPVLLIHGTGDTNITPDHSERLHTAGPTTELWEPAGAGHVDALRHDPAGYEQRVIGWLTGH
jgi:pimeloyl-ACP methyl ester carboxylesterase